MVNTLVEAFNLVIQLTNFYKTNHSVWVTRSWLSGIPEANLYVCVAVIELNHYHVKLETTTRDLAHSDVLQSKIIFMLNFRTGDS